MVLDTPGGLRGFDLARVAAFADVIVMPVCNSVFDRESAAECHAELMALPRIASGRCKVAAIGMRIDARTKAAETLAVWARGLKLPFIGVLREAQVYVRSIEQGLTLFDLPAEHVGADLAQWQTIVDWLEPVLRIVHRPAVHGNARVVRLEPANDRVVLGVATAASSPRALPVRPRPASIERSRPALSPRLAGWLGWLTSPRADAV